MFVIGLTGGIGTGKTEVAKVLKELGAVVIEADKVAHLSYEPGTPAYTAIVDQFGSQVVDESGVIDRRVLGERVFSDDSQRLKLEQIVWPAAKQWVVDRLGEEERNGSKIVAIEVPKLFEAGWDDLADTIWTVEAPEDLIAQRVAVRSGLSESAVQARAEAQLGREGRIARANLVIENDGSIQQLRDQISNLWEEVPNQTDRDAK